MPGSSAGKVCSGARGGGSAFNNPGNRKLAGDTPWLALKPPQPAVKTRRLAHAAVRSSFHCNLTKPQYKSGAWRVQHLNFSPKKDCRLAVWRYGRLTNGDMWRSLGTRNEQSAGGRLPGCICFLFCLCVSLFRSSATADEEQPRVRAQTAYHEKEKDFQNQPKDIESAWKLGRACFDLAELATNSTERAQIAEKGIGVCRQALLMNSNSAAAHYYLGLNLGELAQTRSVGALKLVPQIEREFMVASDLDKSFDFAGADRTLGLLYRDAPSIISLGSRSKAKQHLRRAVELAPDFPENRLDLIESYQKWGDRSEAKRELAVLEAAWPKAKEKLTGPEWTSSWRDWEARLEECKKKVEEASKLESPRH